MPDSKSSRRSKGRAVPAATDIQEFQRLFFPPKWREPVRMEQPQGLTEENDTVGRVLREFRRALTT